jgi:hypothetical protein
MDSGRYELRLGRVKVDWLASSRRMIVFLIHLLHHRSPPFSHRSRSALTGHFLGKFIMDYSLTKLVELAVAFIIA